MKPTHRLPCSTQIEQLTVAQIVLVVESEMLSEPGANLVPGTIEIKTFLTMLSQFIADQWVVGPIAVA